MKLPDRQECFPEGMTLEEARERGLTETQALARILRAANVTPTGDHLADLTTAARWLAAFMEDALADRSLIYHGIYGEFRPPAGQPKGDIWRAVGNHLNLPKSTVHRHAHSEDIYPSVMKFRPETGPDYK